jgi:plasmid stabilization system protein ParE
MRVVYGRRAQKDIAEIYDHIAKRNPKAAQTIEDVIRTNCEQIGKFPFASPRTDARDTYRKPVVTYPYTIFYRVLASRDEVQIARVVHAARVKNLRRVPR